jgi:quinol monooxygenase YgiN
MVVLIVKFVVKPGCGDAFKQHMRFMEENSRKEPGCLMYIGHQSTEDPTHFAFYEQYTDKAALEAHAASPYFAEHVTNGLFKLEVSHELGFFEPIS